MPRGSPGVIRRVIGEADGLQKYLIDGATEDAVLGRLEAEEARHTGFTDLGLDVVRWSPREAIDGSAIHARFQRAVRPCAQVVLSTIFRCS